MIVPRNVRLKFSTLCFVLIFLQRDVAIVQGSGTVIKNGERVVIIFGKTIRVLPYSG